MSSIKQRNAWKTKENGKGGVSRCPFFLIFVFVSHIISNIQHTRADAMASAQ